MKVYIKTCNKGTSVKLLLLTLLLFPLLSCGNRYDTEDLFGTWVYRKDNQEMTISFKRDYTLEMYIKDSPENKKITGRFEVDFFKSPIPLSINKLDKINHPLHTIIQFESSSKIRIAAFSPRWRLRPIIFKYDTDMIFEKLFY